ncbi:MAG TPA: contractile injection system protein, VgrG/Pvc8 family [Rhodocyclaceae bacterium]|nr:contractile injection system protein, VgrG/Pvc8 family [Rhodocyclaceae bacterium]
MNAPLTQPMNRVLRTGEEAVPGIAPLYLECQITMVNGSILGHESFRLEEVEGRESVSEPFEFNLTLHGNSEAKLDTLAFSSLVGRPVNMGIGLPDAAEARGRSVWTLSQKLPNGRIEMRRLAVFNGIVAGFGMQEPGVYQLTMRPTLWRTTLTNHYRMFRNMSVRDVLAALCDEHRIVANLEALGGHGNLATTRVQDWLQAGESDYEFMRRLMGKAHIFYYFVHEYGRHTLVFANAAGYPGIFDDNRPLRYTWTSEEELGLHQWDVVGQYGIQLNLGSSGVRGVFATEGQAANVESGIAGYATFSANIPQNAGELPFRQYRIYQYGGSNPEVRHYTQATNNALQTGYIQLSGASFCPLLRVGHRFRLSAMGLPVRPELERAPFVATAVTHKANLDGVYSNQFQATDAAGLITPISLADTQQGSLLAKVVAHRELKQPGAWPYYTPDNFDMQKEDLQDSQGVPDELQARGVYVRFSTDADDDKADPVWVKLMPSLQSIPEVGTMVLVSRANDESELPEIQAIHADGAMTVTPSDWTAHTHVGNTFSTSYSDGKSVRFSIGHWSRGDTDAAVKIVEDAYGRKTATGKNLFRDASYSRGGGYSYACSENMEKGMLSQSDNYGCGYSNSWAVENKSFSAIGRTYHESVIGSSDTSRHSTEADEPDAKTAVQASKSLVLGDTWSKSISRGNTKGIVEYHGNVDSNTLHDGKVNSVTRHTGDVDTNTQFETKLKSYTKHGGTVDSTTLHEAKVTSTTTINADTDTTSKITGTSTSHTNHHAVKSYTTISTSYSNDDIGTTTSESKVGSRTQTSNTGSVSDTAHTGTIDSKNFTGASSNINITGASSNISVTGAHSNISVTGVSSNIEVLGGGIALKVQAGVVSVDISGPVINIPIVFLIL